MHVKKCLFEILTSDCFCCRRSDGVVAGHHGWTPGADPSQAHHLDLPTLCQHQTWTVVTLCLQQPHAIRRTAAVAGEGLKWQVRG